MTRRILACLSLGLVFSCTLDPAIAQRPGRGGGGRGSREGGGAASASAAASLTLRSIGPALTSGRVIAFAVQPTDPTTYYVAAASGAVWKTTNNGTTFTPICAADACRIRPTNG